MKDELDDDSVFIQFTSLNKLKNPDLLLKNPMNISNFYLFNQRVGCKTLAMESEVLNAVGNVERIFYFEKN